MSLSSRHESDGRLHRARSAMCKIAALGLNREEVLALFDCVTGSVPQAPVKVGEDTELSGEERLQVAQEAIQKLISLGFLETDIATLSGLSTSTISRAMDPDEARISSEITVARLRSVLRRAGTERLKSLLPQLKLVVLDTCGDKGRSLDEARRKELNADVLDVLMGVLVNAEPPGELSRGVRGALVQVGEDDHGVVLIVAPGGGAKTTKQRLSVARAREHEAAHVYRRCRAERADLERLAGIEESDAPPKDGYTA